MKRIIVSVFLLLTVIAAGRAEEEKFSQSVTPDDFTSAGLDLLSPAQRARLDALVSAYKSGALAAARRSANEALLAKQAAELAKQSAEAEAKAAKTEAAEAKAAKVEAAKAADIRIETAKAETAEVKKNNAGLLARATAVFKPSAKTKDAKPSEPVVESTIPGKFRGWEGRAIFELANGQRWQVANNGENFYTPVVENPRVQIMPASMAGNWLRFPDLDTQVRVIFVGDK